MAIGVARFSLVMFIFASLAALAPAAAGEEVNSGGGSVLKEIIVTAQKTHQNLQTVPVSVEALTARALAAQEITTTEALGTATPGLIVNDYGNPVITVFTLRGVQEFDFGDHQESPIAVFEDGAYLPFLAAVGLDFFDLDRVEVLRGPQGTLFGRNATGGAIQLISAKPTEDFTGYGQIDAGNYNARRIEGAVSGPLGDGWLARLSILKDEHSGYYHNLNGIDSGNANDLSWRAQLARRFSESADLALEIFGSHDDTTSSPYQPAPAYPDPKSGLIYPASSNPAAFAAFCSSFFATTVVPQATDCLSGDVATGSPFTIQPDHVGGFSRDYFGSIATFQWFYGPATLTSITSYGYLKKNYANEDSDGTSLNILTFGQTVNANDVSEELRLAGKSARNSWIVGVYGLRIDGNYGTNVGYYPFDPALTAATANAYGLKTVTYALFGQTEYTIVPTWTVTGGLRWTEDDKNFSMVTPCSGPGCGLLGLTNPIYVQGTGYTSSVPGAQTTRDSGNWDGKLQFNWRPDGNLLGYAGVTRGTKAGGFNGGASAFYALSQAIFKDEVLTDYEVGEKYQFAGGRARLNSSVFYYDYRDMQVFNQLGISTVTFNSNGSIYGSEIELQTLLAGLHFDLGTSLLHTHIAPVANVNTITGALVYASEELPNSPHATVHAELSKTWGLQAGLLTVDSDARWVGSHKLNLIDDPATNEPSYYTLDARATYAWANGRWAVSLYSQNLTNQIYRIVATPFVGTDGSIIELYGPPRTYGASLRVQF